MKHLFWTSRICFQYSHAKTDFVFFSSLLNFFDTLCPVHVSFLIEFNFTGVAKRAVLKLNSLYKFLYMYVFEYWNYCSPKTDDTMSKECLKLKIIVLPLYVTFNSWPISFHCVLHVNAQAIWTIHLYMYQHYLEEWIFPHSVRFVTAEPFFDFCKEYAIFLFICSQSQTETICL